MYSVNAVNASSVLRTVAECKKKMAGCQKCNQKKRGYQNNSSKNYWRGPPPVCSFKPWESNVLQSLTRTQVEGIEGGVDTLEQCGLTSISSENYDSTTTFTAEVHMANSPEDEAVCNIEEASVPQENSYLEKEIDDQEVQEKFLKIEEENHKKNGGLQKTKTVNLRKVCCGRRKDGRRSTQYLFIISTHGNYKYNSTINNLILQE
ncbi:unnamed protein product [Mytilus coruscus]|uniref:Uncharacterized protein n=1 Tax=Mytilus coruscus TaxID=42192 RepID=A0A6J8EHZ5_MYTCO|nr:unnamed protein product [Mytilus coruscus]